jgi:hypothetical protein
MEPAVYLRFALVSVLIIFGCGQVHGNGFIAQDEQRQAQSLG